MCRMRRAAHSADTGIAGAPGRFRWDTRSGRPDAHSSHRPRTMTSLPLALTNADTATFDCTFGRGCEGICCRNGRPSVTPAEQAAMASVLPRVLPLLRPEAKKVMEAEGFVSAR